MPVYVSLFNLILKTGIIPDEWAVGKIRPINKNKGPMSDPNNYRPITILSCLNKLFTAVLNDRLYELFGRKRYPTRKSGWLYSTSDHIFSLHALIEIMKFEKKKLFCSFVDFSKAFDSVWRSGFTFGERTLEFVHTYKYLGAVFSKSGSFLHARKHIAEQAKKGMYLLNKRIKNLDLPIDLQLKLFDNTILSILTYGCEMYGFEDYKMLEVVQNQFLRCLANFRKSTPLYMILGEFGRYPLEITIKNRMIGFWVRILTNKHSKLSYILYRKLIETPNLNSKWVTKIKQILDECGMSEVWLTQTPSQNIPKIVSETLRNQFCQKWNSDLNNSSKGRNYGIFKESINLEEYFLKLRPKLYTSLAKFRTANHRFPCEVLRWQNIELSERRCHLCDDDVGDEMHYLLICPFFSDERPKYIKRYYSARPNILKFTTSKYEKFE